MHSPPPRGGQEELPYEMTRVNVENWKIRKEPQCIIINRYIENPKPLKNNSVA